MYVNVAGHAELNIQTLIGCRYEDKMPIVKYSGWENEDENLTPVVVEMLLSENKYRPQLESMLYATKGMVKSVKLLSPKDLELLAVSFYQRLGYKKVRHAGKYGSDGGVDVWLTTHDAEIEIVQCKQFSSKITREHIKEFVKTMRRVGAIHGYYWAPSGFSQPAIEYIESKENIMIDLYDASRIEKEIHQLFYDEVQLARKKLNHKISPLNNVEKINVQAFENNEGSESNVGIQKTYHPAPKKKIVGRWKVSQVLIIFGLLIIACLTIYCLLTTLVSGST